MGTTHLSFIPAQQSPPTFHSWIPRSALVMASHSAVHCPRQARGRLPPGHSEASGSDLSDTGRVVPITDALALLTARSHVAPALAWGKSHEDLSLGWAELNNRSRNTPQRGHAEVVRLFWHQWREQDPLKEMTRKAITLGETGVRTLAIVMPALGSIWKMSWKSKISLFKFKFISIIVKKFRTTEKWRQ